MGTIKQLLDVTSVIVFEEGACSCGNMQEVLFLLSLFIHCCTFTVKIFNSIINVISSLCPSLSLHWPLAQMTTAMNTWRSDNACKHWIHTDSFKQCKTVINQLCLLQMDQKDDWVGLNHLQSLLLSKHMAESQTLFKMASCAHDAKCFSVKLFLFVFITARAFNPALDSLTWPQSRRYRWSMNKVPLTDLQAMSIKIERHVLCVIRSHAASTPHWWHITCKFVQSRTNISHICFF